VPRARWRSGRRLPGVTEQGEAVVEPPGDLLHGQCFRPGRGQLDGEWQPVQRPTEFLNGGGGVGIEDERLAALARALREQRHRIGDRQRLQGLPR